MPISPEGTTQDANPRLGKVRAVLRAHRRGTVFDMLHLVLTAMLTILVVIYVVEVGQRGPGTAGLAGLVVAVLGFIVIGIITRLFVVSVLMWVVPRGGYWEYLVDCYLVSHFPESFVAIGEATKDELEAQRRDT